MVFLRCRGCFPLHIKRWRFCFSGLSCRKMPPLPMTKRCRLPLVVARALLTDKLAGVWGEEIEELKNCGNVGLRDCGIGELRD